jgi:hypothetical protein
MDALFLLVIVGIVGFLCWKCEINQSMLALIIMLGLSLFVLAHPGRESFASDSDSVPVTTDNLQKAGIVRPSVFNCANQIGVTAEMSYLFANKMDV